MTSRPWNDTSAMTPKVGSTAEIQCAGAPSVGRCSDKVLAFVRQRGLLAQKNSKPNDRIWIIFRIA